MRAYSGARGLRAGVRAMQLRPSGQPLTAALVAATADLSHARKQAPGAG